mgnify:CR=1 FL=1
MANTPNWQTDLATAMMPLVSNIIISDVQYFKLKAQYRKSRQANEREHEQFDEQEEEQNEQQIENNFSFIPVKSASLNGANNSNNNKSHSSSSRSPSIPLQSIQSYESDQIANVASIPLNAGGKFSQHFEEPRDQMNEDGEQYEQFSEEEVANENDDEENERDQQEAKKMASQNMSQNGLKLVNYSNSESAHNNHSNDQEPRPSLLTKKIASMRKKKILRKLWRSKNSARKSLKRNIILKIVERAQAIVKEVVVDRNTVSPS